MAEVFSVSRAGYYKHIKRKKSATKVKDEELAGKIKEIYLKNRKIYGSPRIHAELKKNNEHCSRKRVAKLMRKNSLQAIMRKRWRPVQKSLHVEVNYPNLVNRNFTAEKANSVWVSDITYIKTNAGWLYVAAILDLYSRNIVGLGMSDIIDTNLIIKALDQAVTHRSPRPGLIIHSDRGCQYLSDKYRAEIERYGFLPSTSQKGSCYDNAAMESFFHTLKTEHVYLHQFKTKEEAMVSIFEYVEVFYNRKRLHSTLKYKSPIDFENQQILGDTQIRI